MNNESFLGLIFNPPRFSVYDNEPNKSVNLWRKDCIKQYLGVLMDENLSWRKHIVTVGQQDKESDWYAI